MSYSDRETKNKKATNKLENPSADSETLSNSTSATKRKGGRPRNENLIREGSQKGLPVDKTRLTLIAQTSDVELLKDLAYTKRLNQAEMFNEVLKAYCEDRMEPGELLHKPEKKS